MTSLSPPVVYQAQDTDRETEEPPQRKQKVEGTSKISEVEYIATAVRNAVVFDQPYESSDDEDKVDPVLMKEYHRQIHDSDGFDVDISIPNASLFVFKCKNENLYHDMIGMCARVGLHWYNHEKGSNFQLSCIEKYNSILCGFGNYITLEANDPSNNNNSSVTFQTFVLRGGCTKGEALCITSEGCRIKPQTQGTGDKLRGWEYIYKIDEAYKSDLPKWFPDNALMQSSDKHNQFYEAKDSDIRQNDWLNMYAEIALYSLREGDWSTKTFESCLPLEIKKVVVQTYEEEDVKAKEKLKAGNAIFYISFNNLSGPVQENYQAIVRRTIDGLPGHVRLGFNCWLE